MTYEIDLQSRIMLRDKSVYFPAIITFENLPKELIWENSYGVMNSEWNEPIEVEVETDRYYYILNNYPEYPLKHIGSHYVTPVIGVFFNGNEWQDIPGYRPPSFAPGYCWENEYIPNQFQNKLTLIR